MKKRQVHNAWVVGGGIAVIAVILLLASWQGGLWLGAKSSPPGIILAQGETYTMTYKTSPSVPTVKIEICRGTRCKTLAGKAGGEQLPVDVPKDYTLGAAYFKVSERNRNGNLTGTVQKTVPIVVIGASDNSGQPAVTPTPSPTPTFSYNFTYGTILAPAGSATPTPKPTPAPYVITPQIGFYCLYFPGYQNYVTSMYATVEWFGSDQTMGIRYRLKGQEKWVMAGQPELSGNRFVSTLYFAPGITGKFLDYNQQFEVQIVPLFEKLTIAGVPSKIYTLSSGSKLPVHGNNRMWCLPVDVAAP